MKVAQSLQYFTGPFHYVTLTEFVSTLERLVKTFPLNVLHDCIDNAIFLNKVIDLREVSMMQAFQRIHFLAEPLRIR